MFYGDKCLVVTNVSWMPRVRGEEYFEVANV